MATAESRGGPWAALPPGLRRLLLEAGAIAGVIAIAAGLVYHFTVHTIKNTRPLGGVNVDVAPELGNQTAPSFAADPGRPGVLVGVLDQLEVYTSGDDGRTWERDRSPRLPGRMCADGGRPRIAVGPGGREYLAFLVGSFCGDSLTPSVAITSRAGPHDRWGPVTRVAAPTWKYGFDDAPDIALDRGSGRVYLAWTRSLRPTEATVVVSASADDGRTWSTPRPVSGSLQHPHLATLAGAGGSVYVAGIDAKLGLWISRSTDGGRTFVAPRTVAPLRANPAAYCALTGTHSSSPLPTEQRACAGPNPTLLVRGDRVLVVYDDAGDNGSQDVYVAALDRNLGQRFRVRVNPPDRDHASQSIPAAAVDATTGVLWACWYDTTFDRRGHRVWFTCSASRNGRAWSTPERAASKPLSSDALLLVRNGIFPAVTARAGVAHAFWPDLRVVDRELDIYTASLPERAALGGG